MGIFYYLSHMNLCRAVTFFGVLDYKLVLDVVVAMIRNILLRQL